jgi:hypothetical protein
MIARRSLLARLLTSCASAIAWVSSPGSARAAAVPLVRKTDLPDEAPLWKSYYDGTRVWGYVDKHSIRPGESFNIMLSTGAASDRITGKLRTYRIGHFANGGRELVAETSELTVEYAGQIQVNSATLGAAFPAAYAMDDTERWRSGLYVFDFLPSADRHEDLDVAFIVVTDRDPAGDILVLLGTNTYQAYNAWGGSSLYDCAFVGTEAQIVSFDRPTRPQYLFADTYLIMWIEKLAADRGLKVGYASNFDLHRERAFAESYRLLISASHNEYCSKEEFDALYRRIFVLGKSAMFLGANAAYWQVRYIDTNGVPGDADRGRQLICYKDDSDPIQDRVTPEQALDLITMKFRDQARWPETMLMGAAYQSYFEDGDPPKRFPYRVTRADLPFFEGTGYSVGQSIGDLVGYEWDNRDPDGDGRRLWDAEKSRIPAIKADSIKVLFSGTPVDNDGKPGLAEAVYFVSKAGAQVFNAGTTSWCWGLGKDGFESQPFKRFNENLVLAFLAQP